MSSRIRELAIHGDAVAAAPEPARGEPDPDRDHDDRRCGEEPPVSGARPGRCRGRHWRCGLGGAIGGTLAAVNAGRRDEGERPRPQRWVRLGLDHGARDRGGPPDARELRHARRTAGEMTGNRSGVSGVACHEPVEPVGLRGRDLDALQRVSVVHHHPS